MNQPTQNIILLVLLLQLASFACLAVEPTLQFQGDAAYSIVEDKVLLSVDRIDNGSDRSSGVIRLRLIATVQPTPYSSFHRLASVSLADSGSSFPDTGGRIPPRSAINYLHVTASFIQPPDGIYYLHLVVSETGDKVQRNSPNRGVRTTDFIDVYSFQQQVTFGDGQSPVMDPDDHGGSFDEATEIYPDSTTAGTLSAADVDVFEVSFARTGLLTIYATGTTDTRATLLDQDGNVLAEDRDALGNNFYISRHLPGGIYFIEVRSDSATPSGRYALRSTFVPGLTAPLPDRQSALSGIFFDPETAGQGFSLYTTVEGLTVFFFGHTATGERLWLVSETIPATIESDGPLVLNMLEVAVGQFGHPEAASLRVWGELQLGFDGCGEINAAWLDGADGSQVMNLRNVSGPPTSCE